MKKTVVITGGAGFIGSNIARKLLQDGYRVKIIDNLSTGRIENLYDILPKIEFLGGDIQDLDFLNKAFRGADYILHQAALPSVPRSIDDPSSSHKVNVDGTFNVFLAACNAKVKKVVFASSSSVYGNRKSDKNKKEILKPLPLSPYAVTKLIGENYAKVFAHIYGLPTVSLRYFNVFGPGQDPNSQYSAVIPKFIKAVLKGERPIIYGDGKQTRDFTFIDNVVHANILAMKSTKVGLGESINIACDDAISLIKLTQTIGKILNKKITPKFEESKKGEVRNSRADIKKAKSLLSYQPKIKFKDGLERTIEWYKENEV
jgi:nucleoside-diphosphate-sugar epimerase